MKLLRARIENFRLLKEVELEFSVDTAVTCRWYVQLTRVAKRRY